MSRLPLDLGTLALDRPFTPTEVAELLERAFAEGRATSDNYGWSPVQGADITKTKTGALVQRLVSKWAK